MIANNGTFSAEPSPSDCNVVVKDELPYVVCTPTQLLLTTSTKIPAIQIHMEGTSGLKRLPRHPTLPTLRPVHNSHVLLGNVKAVRARAASISLFGSHNTITNLLALPRGSLVVTAHTDNLLRVFSLQSFACLRSFPVHTGRLHDLTLFPDARRMFSTDSDGRVCLWSVSENGIALLHQFRFSTCAIVVSFLRDGHFIISTTTGTLLSVTYSHNANIKLIRNRSETIECYTSQKVDRIEAAHEDVVKAAAANSDYFVTVSRDHRAKVWNSSSLSCIATLEGHKDEVWTVAISEQYILTGSVDATIRVYDSKSFKLHREIKTEGLVMTLQTFGPDPLVLYTAGDFVVVRTILSGRCLWKQAFTDRIWRCAVLGDGSLALGTSQNVSIQVHPPKYIAEQLAPSSRLSQSNTPLQDALCSVLDGRSVPAQHCKTVITADACAQSLPEWYSAHQLLMLALFDGEISPSTTFGDRQNWWFLQLYAVSCKLQFQGKEDVETVQQCLQEAKMTGVIETVEAALGNLVLAQHLSEEIRVLHRAGILVCERLLIVDDRLAKLRKSFENYKSAQLTSKLIGIALQIIPIVGGAAAGVLSAGADVVEGLSIKDVADYIFGLGQNLNPSDVSSFGARVLRRGGDAIAPEILQELEEDPRNELEELVSDAGLRLDELRNLFMKTALKIENIRDSPKDKDNVNPDDNLTDEIRS